MENTKQELTPIGKAIEEVTNLLHNNYIHESDVLGILKNLLPAEREVIEKTFTEGNRQEFYDGSETICKNYFENNFKQ